MTDSEEKVNGKTTLDWANHLVEFCNYNQDEAKIQAISAAQNYHQTPARFWYEVLLSISLAEGYRPE